jgi:ubiquinone/menaquinone biosynthesis C-methylase UbiE
LAEATSREECIERHRTYSIDVSRRLNSLQRERLKRMCRPVHPCDTVLDVGCNSGYIVEFLPPRCTAYGVDVSDELVQRAKKRLKEARLAAAERLPYGDKSMDCVLLGEILEHVHDPVEVLREASRVARRIVTGSTPHEAGKWGPKGTKAPDTHRFHVRCFTQETLLETLKAAGLVGIRIDTVARDRVPQMYVFWGSPSA